MSQQQNNQSITETEVLFQKLGHTWFAFSEVGENFVYTALPTGIDPRTTKLELYELIEDHLKKVSSKGLSKAQISA